MLILHREFWDLSSFYSVFGTPATIAKVVLVELCLLSSSLLVQPCFQVTIISMKYTLLVYKTSSL